MQHKKILMIVLNDFINDSRIIKEASTLSNNGYSVKVLALHNKGLERREKINNFEVERIHLSTRNKLNNNRYVQLIKYVEFFIKSSNIAKNFKPDILHAHNTSALPISLYLSAKLNIKVIYDSHELNSHSAGKENNPKIFNKISFLFEKYAINKKVDEVITVSNSIANYLNENYSFKKKINVIRNIPYNFNLDKNYNLFRKEFGFSKKNKIILYQGLLSKGRGIENIIRSMKLINEKVRFVILGDGPYKDELKELMINLNLDERIFFHQAVSYDILHKYTNSADLGIHLIANTCLNHYFALPNKIFEYIQAELPVICSDFPDMSKIIEDYNVGLTVSPKDIETFAKKVNETIFNNKKMSKLRNNCKEAKKVLNWENESDELLKIYKNNL